MPATTVSLFLPDPDDINGPIQIAIGLFNQRTTIVPMWALIFDEGPNYSKYRFTNRNVVGLVRKPNPTPEFPTDFKWVLEGKWENDELKDPLAIIHVGEIMSTCDELRKFLLRLDAGRPIVRDPREFGGINVWGSAAWVIRALWHLNEKFVEMKDERRSECRNLKEQPEPPRFLPCIPSAIYPNIYNNLDRLRKEKKRVELESRHPVLTYSLQALHELGTMNR